MKTVKTVAKYLFIIVITLVWVGALAALWSPGDTLTCNEDAVVVQEVWPEYEPGDAFDRCIPLDSVIEAFETRWQ